MVCLTSPFLGAGGLCLFHPGPPLWVRKLLTGGANPSPPSKIGAKKKGKNMNKKITRTIKTAVVKVLALDLDSAETINKTYILSANMVKNGVINEKKAMKIMESMSPENVKPVKIVDVELVEKQYSMLVSDFIRYSIETNVNLLG